MGKKKDEKKGGKKARTRARNNDKAKVARDGKVKTKGAAAPLTAVAGNSKAITAAATKKTGTATKKTPRRPTTARKTAGAWARVSPELRHRVIADLAYFLAERRRAGKDDSVDDWLEAERAVDRVLRALGQDPAKVAAA